MKKDEFYKLYENRRITILNKNRIKIPCNKCGGIGILRIKIETIKKGIPIQLFVCEKCNGTGIESQKVLQREHKANRNFLYPISCNVCEGTGILKRN